MTILVLISTVFVIIREMFRGRISLNSVLLLLLVKYQVKSHSSSWFSAACAAAIIHRNHFFRLYQKDKCSDSKVKFRDRQVIVTKGFLKLPNLHMLTKQKSQSHPRNLALGTFGELLIVFSTKVNLLYLLYSTTRSCCLLHLTKQTFGENFLRALIVMTQVSLYLLSLLELI